VTATIRLRATTWRLAVCRLPADSPPPAWVFHAEAEFFSVTRTPDELSVVCSEDDLPPGLERVEHGWRAFALEGPVPFTTTGVIASLTVPLAQAKIPVFVVSTFDTDYLLVKAVDLARAMDLLRRQGHTVRP
jgi:hypothetical protein